jgi:hypothetical protein
MDAFNVILGQFVQELAATFPEDVTLKTFSDGYPLFVSISPNAPFDLFIKNASPHSERIMNKDETLMTDGAFQLVDGIDIKKLWTSPGVTDKTKQSIWSHLQNLTVLAGALRVIPPQMMGIISQTAKNIAQQMGNGQSPADAQQMMSQALMMIGGGASGGNVTSQKSLQ